MSDEEHEMCFDLTTPRAYTAHGNWNQRCSCGLHLSDDPAEARRRFDEHMKEIGA